MRRLIALEKARRGVDSGTLVFVGTHNVAQYFWCGMQAVLKSRRNESDFFAAYLDDRLNYAHDLGLLSELPTDDEAVLAVGDQIELSHVEQLLARKAASDEVRRRRLLGASGMPSDDPHVPLNPSMTRADFQQTEAILRKLNGPRAPHAMAMGDFVESHRAEWYPNIRWNFRWDRYSVVGIPDGIAESFVYEFKATGSRFWSTFATPVAKVQADLYAFFFHRNRRRVQVYVREDDKVETYDEDAAPARALEVLQKFKAVDDGSLPLPPKPVKCKACDAEFREKCRIRPL